MMKNIIICALLLGTISYSIAMQHASIEIQDMCKNANANNEEKTKYKENSAKHHCDILAKYFYCAYTMNTNATPAVESYCHHVYLYKRFSRITGLPTTWDLSYHVKSLAEARNKSAEETVDYIDKAATTMGSFVKMNDQSKSEVESKAQDKE